MSSIEISLQCARCNRELIVAPPLLFKYPALTITVMHCDCKDEKISKIAIHNCNDNIVGELPNYYCGICGERLP